MVASTTSPDQPASQPMQAASIKEPSSSTSRTFTAASLPVEAFLATILLLVAIIIIRASVQLGILMGEHQVVVILMAELREAAILMEEEEHLEAISLEEHLEAMLVVEVVSVANLERMAGSSYQVCVVWTGCAAWT